MCTVIVGCLLKGRIMGPLARCAPPSPSPSGAAPLQELALWNGLADCYDLGLIKAAGEGCKVKCAGRGLLGDGCRVRFMTL